MLASDGMLEIVIGMRLPEELVTITGRTDVSPLVIGAEVVSTGSVETGPLRSPVDDVTVGVSVSIVVVVTGVSVVDSSVVEEEVSTVEDSMDEELGSLVVDSVVEVAVSVMTGPCVLDVGVTGRVIVRVDSVDVEDCVEDSVVGSSVVDSSELEDGISIDVIRLVGEVVTGKGDEVRIEVLEDVDDRVDDVRELGDLVGDAVPSTTYSVYITVSK